MINTTDKETKAELAAAAAERKRYYVDKVAMYDALVEYRKVCDIARETGTDFPQVPNFIAECFMKIAKHLSYHHWFRGFSYKDDMIGDAVEACIRYCKSFDVNKTKEPFSYFTRTCWQCFRHRCDLEYSETLLKGELLSDMAIDTMFMDDNSGEDNDSVNNMRSFIIENSTYGKRPEKKKRVKPKKDYSSPLDSLYETA